MTDANGGAATDALLREHCAGGGELCAADLLRMSGTPINFMRVPCVCCC